MRGHDITTASTPEELANKLHKLKMKNIQFALSASFSEISDPYKLNPGMGTYFKQLFRRYDIQIALLSCYSNLIHPDKISREKILQKFETYLEHGKFFGASMVASETGSILPNLGYSELNFSDTVFDDLIEVIQRLVKKGEETGVMVGIEAGLNHPLYSNERIEDLLRKVSSHQLGIIYDPTNLITVETYTHQVEMVRDAFKNFGNKIVCVHLKDFVIESDKIKVVPLGEGIIDFKAILKIVSSYRPYCYVVLEGTKDDKIIKALNLLNFFN